MARTYAGEAQSAPAGRRTDIRQVRDGDLWLVAVALAFTACEFLFVRVHLGLGFDESVYVSQVSPRAPASFFSAPRARGVSYLAAPAVAVTSSTAALRCYLALLAGAGLLGALWVWRHFLPARRVALAGVLFAGLWITQFYGPQAMPNLWVALAALACVGLFLRSVSATCPARTERGALLGTALTLAAAVQLRPPDGFWLVLPLAAAALAVRAWRRAPVFGALAAGVVAGGAQWVVESYTRYGGVLQRLHTSGKVEGGFSWSPAFADQLRALGGRTLCRPCDVPWPHKGVTLWWFALPLLVVGGLLVVRHARRLPAVLLPALCGASMAVPYLLLIGYAAPRFLLPSYALLALPAAECLAWFAAGAGRPRLRPVATGLVVLVVAAHLVVQNLVLTRTATRNSQAHAGFARIAAALHAAGVNPPCLVTGTNAIPIGLAARCASGATSGHNANTTPRGITAAARHRPVAVLVPRGHPRPPYAKGWSAHPMPVSHRLTPYTAYVSPP
ncbi:hypothetical protein, partial [Streptomyces sp. NRRL F-5126]|uniref:hypothetical protein n=1 Tax=Streptomyces sp. NRRL F-5126 TaxID=1463857 RepID=UPI000560BD92